jgi:hypothetical protein
MMCRMSRIKHGNYPALSGNYQRIDVPDLKFM